MFQTLIDNRPAIHKSFAEGSRNTSSIIEFLQISHNQRYVESVIHRGRTIEDARRNAPLKTYHATSPTQSIEPVKETSEHRTTITQPSRFSERSETYRPIKSNRGTSQPPYINDRRQLRYSEEHNGSAPPGGPRTANPVNKGII